MTAALEGGEWSVARPGRTLRPGKDPLPILQEALKERFISYITKAVQLG